MCGDPAVILGYDPFQKLLKDEDATAVSGNMRVHGQQEHPTFCIGALEFSQEDVQHIRGRRIGALRPEAVHHEIHRIVAAPFDRQLDHTCRLSILQDLIGVVVREQRAVI